MAISFSISTESLWEIDAIAFDVFDSNTQLQQVNNLSKINSIQDPSVSQLLTDLLTRYCSQFNKFK